jgi:hypothetical protein
MAETIAWIAAGEALRLASDQLGAEAAQAALVAGAESGRIRTRASRFTVELPNACGQKMRFEDELVELPEEFWSSTGRTPIERDWAAGNFTTLVNDNFHHQAIGVEFDQAGIEAVVRPAR